MRKRVSLTSGTSIGRLRLAIITAALALGASTPLCRSGQSNQTGQAEAPSSVPWQVNQVLQPEALAKTLSSPAAGKPLVICVGFRILYEGGHIVGAKFAGPASNAEGIEALKREVKDLPRNKQIVLYCGCCPWKRCPNVRPAFQTLEELGFTNVKVLSIPENFREDWIAKGYPIEKGSGKQ